MKRWLCLLFGHRLRVLYGRNPKYCFRPVCWIVLCERCGAKGEACNSADISEGILRDCV